MTTPENWQMVNSGYNDNINIITPFPRVTLSIGLQQGAMVWVEEGIGGQGVAMFDAPVRNWTGLRGSNRMYNVQFFGVFPNPQDEHILCLL